MNKLILYYRRNVYGNELEYVADSGDAKVIQQLTGKATVNGATRELLRDLTGGYIQWREIVAP